MKDRDLLIIALCGLAGMALMIRRDHKARTGQLRQIAELAADGAAQARRGAFNSGMAEFRAERIERTLSERA